MLVAVLLPGVDPVADLPLEHAEKPTAAIAARLAAATVLV